MTHLVFTEVPAFRSAVAELAPRVRPAQDATGRGIRIIDGTGSWWERVLDGQGATGFVVDEPAPAHLAAHERLLSTRVPVVALRRRLRPDVARDARPLDVPPHVVVDARGPRADAGRLLRDAVGWARVLSGSTLDVVRRDASDLAEIVALVGTGGRGASVTCAAAGGTGGAIIAVALGARRVEVRVDPAGRLTEVVHDDEHGRTVPPTRLESPERLALRRLIDAIEGAERPLDLADLREDDRVALAE